MMYTSSFTLALRRTAMTALVCILVVGCLASAAGADDSRGGFVIRTAYTELLNGVYYLSADVDLDMSQDALNALENGVPLTVEWQIEVIKHRSFIWDKTVATLTERFQISYRIATRQLG